MNPFLHGRELSFFAFAIIGNHPSGSLVFAGLMERNVFSGSLTLAGVFGKT